MLVTGLRKLKRGNRIAVYLDGEYGFSVELNTLVRERISEGVSMTEKDVENILFSDLVEYLYLKVLALLGRRPRSRFEVKRYLNEKLRKYEKPVSSESVVLEVLHRLDERNYLDDVEFAKVYLESLRAKNKYSDSEVRAKLASRGIERQVVDQVLGENSADQNAVIAALIAKHSSRIRSKSKTEHEYRQKMMQYLSRKGFGWDAIKSAF